MKDFDKIKEKKKSDDMRGIIILSIIFLIAFALIVFAIIKLTNQYFDLKMKLEESRNEQQVQLTDPGEGQTYQFNTTDEEDNIQRSEEALKELSEMSILDEEKQVPDEEPASSTGSDGLADKNKSSENKPAQKRQEESSRNLSKEEAGSKTEIVTKKAGHYLVQILSVKSKTDADRAAESLKKIAPDVYVVRADLGDKGIWYRVRCCKDTSLDYAKYIVGNIKKETPYTPMVLNSSK